MAALTRHLILTQRITSKVKNKDLKVLVEWKRVEKLRDEISPL